MIVFEKHWQLGHLGNHGHWEEGEHKSNQHVYLVISNLQMAAQHKTNNTYKGHNFSLNHLAWTKSRQGVVLRSRRFCSPDPIVAPNPEGS